MSKWRHLPVKAAADIFTLEQQGRISRAVGKDLLTLTLATNALLEITGGPKPYEYVLEHDPGPLAWFAERVSSLQHVGKL